MKLLFIYLAVVLAIAFYVWVNIFKEGIIGTKEDSMTIKEVEMNAIRELINGKNKNGTLNGQSTDKDTKQLLSNKVTPGITTIDRYEDNACRVDEYIYCVDGKIECQDIFGSVVSDPNSLQTIDSSYKTGNTFKNTCGSYINKTNLSDYTTELRQKFSNTKGVYFDPSGHYFDLSRNKIPSECTTEKPWRVGGNNGVPMQGCYPSESEADTAWFSYLNTFFNENAIYSKNDNIYVLSSFLNSPEFLNNNPGTLSLLQLIDKSTNASSKSYTTINGQKYYYGTINEVTGDTYSVSLTNAPKPMNDDSTIIKNVPKTALLKDSLYNPKTNDYYSNLKSGIQTGRPICKSGTFTSCLSSAPFSIKNGEYVPEKDPLVLDASYNKYRKQSQIDLLTNTPFSSPGVNPSGIIDNSNLLEYNYFTSKDKEAPFIKCIANFGSKVGDPLCCNQIGTLKDTKRICPEEVPTCNGYSVSDNVYGYCS
jgi:hypothetical protein